MGRCLLLNHNATLLQGELLLKALQWFPSTLLFMLLSFSTLVDSSQLLFVYTGFPLLPEPAWRVLKWFFTYLNLSYYFVPLDLLFPFLIWYINFISTYISPSFTLLNILPLSLLCYLSTPLSLHFLFLNTSWFLSMLFEWHTVSSTGGKEKKEKSVDGPSLRPLHQMGQADCTGLTVTTSSFARIVWIFLLSH